MKKKRKTVTLKSVEACVLAWVKRAAAMERQMAEMEAKIKELREQVYDLKYPRLTVDGNMFTGWKGF